MAEIMTAATEYAKRPADECYASLGDLITAASEDKANSFETAYSLTKLRAVPKDGGIVLESPKGQATLTHFSFGQLCRTIGAPASYLRDLDPRIAADCINDGIESQDVNLLLRVPADSTKLPVVRAVTTQTYGRLWDAPLYQQVDRYFGDGVSSIDGVWQAPPVWEQFKKPGGSYRGDRDSFVIRVDGGSIVDDPRGFGAIGQSGGRLHRGVIFRNSEVGNDKPVEGITVLFDAICGNHILWGAVIESNYRRKHSGKRVESDVIAEMQEIAKRFNNRPASEDTRIIRALVSNELGNCKEAVVEVVRGFGATKSVAEAAYQIAEEQETSFSPRSFWGYSAGLTRLSQQSGYQDERFTLDAIAADILAKGAKQYAMA